MFAVVVTFKISPGDWDAFLPLMAQNAKSSRETEPGCHQFDVWTDDNRPGEVFLYEVYSSREAFDAHRETDHFREFDRQVAGMIVHHHY